MGRTLCSVMVLLLSAVFAGRCEAQALKIGVFDPQAVSENTAVGKKVQAQLTAFRDRKQSEIRDKEKAVSDLQRQLEQQELSLSAERRTAMEKDIQRQLLDLQSARESATRELQLEIGAAQSDFEEKLGLAVRAYGKEGAYTLILDRGLVAWADDSTDVTDQIVERFNQMFPGQEGE